MKKKNSVYFLLPIAGLIVFGAIYWRFLSENDKLEEVRADKAKAAKEEKLRKTQADALTAYNNALVGTTKRIEEKKARDLKKQQDDDYRQLIIAERLKAVSEAAQSEKAEDAASRKLAEAKKELAAVEAMKKKAIEDQAHYIELAKQAETARKANMDAVEKVAAADFAVRKAREDAAKAAAEAKK